MSVYLQDGKVLLNGGSVAIDEACCCGGGCDDLPPTNPTGPPVHINIAMTMSGGCDDITVSGTVTYDADLSFHLEGPVGGHTFCAHDIWANGQGHGDFWSGHWTVTCGTGGSTDFGGGAAGLLGRDIVDGTWWMVLPSFNRVPAPGSCAGCPWGPLTPLPFQQIAGAGDPSGIYVYSDSDMGITLTVTVTIT